MPTKYFGRNMPGPMQPMIALLCDGLSGKARMIKTGQNKPAMSLFRWMANLGTTETYVGRTRSDAVQRKLRSQYANSVLRKDACLLYFKKFRKITALFDEERPIHNLDEMINNDLRGRTW